jgi:hypothetical protein
MDTCPHRPAEPSGAGGEVLILSDSGSVVAADSVADLSREAGLTRYGWNALGQGFKTMRNGPRTGP